MTLAAAYPKLTAHALALTTVSIKSAKDYPVENADPFPMVLVHLLNGGGVAVNASMMKFLPHVAADFMFGRSSLTEAYTKADLAAVEFLKRLAGDPTLTGSVDTIIFSDDQHPTFDITHEEWNGVPIVLLRFDIPIKTLETPIT